MAVSHEFSASVDSVYELLTDPDFLVERSVALGEDCEAEVEDYEDETVIKLKRRVTRELPAFLAKMFNPVQTINMTETWRPDGDDWEGDFEMTVEGQPVVIRGEFTLKSSKKGSVYTVSHSCKAKIPLVGGKVEKFVLSQTSSGAEDELNYAASRLI
ncbi:hypothetical protein FHR99_002840 [Litorivivens lipolytica]|uniref:DUF2505 domain-containing protein n=1 Tax=Litorivivens lipolytica TaxID=1524264 RepID=A0A7W4W6U2_9GAMM|nr:DUF2505 domain-containing protein [Litorivivens lipolytica]MBB3048566.1 hypothetical protein [Litorivivens lipolytica]